MSATSGAAAGLVSREDSGRGPGARALGWSLGGTFVALGLLKVLSPPESFLPGGAGVARALAPLDAFLPLGAAAVEIGVGVWLASGRGALWAARVASLLAATFCAYHVVQIALGNGGRSCGCLGTAVDASSTTVAVVSAFLLAASTRLSTLAAAAAAERRP